MTAMTTAIDFADVITAVLAAGAAIMAVVVIMKGVQYVLRAVKGA